MYGLYVGDLCMVYVCGLCVWFMCVVHECGRCVAYMRVASVREVYV